MRSSQNGALIVVVLIAAMGVLGAHAARAASGAALYTYDALGRIATASYDTGVIIIYSYDANGNRTAQVVNVNSGALTWTATATPCTANCWGSGLWSN